MKEINQIDHNQQHSLSLGRQIVLDEGQVVVRVVVVLLPFCWLDSEHITVLMVPAALQAEQKKKTFNIPQIVVPPRLHDAFTSPRSSIYFIY